MICPRCQGNIKRNSNCEKCGISYDELISSINHDEMKRLFKKIGEKMKNHESIFIEESLLAVEIKNSSFLVPLIVDEDSIAVMNVEDENRKRFITIFTDIEEYSKCVEDLTPSTNPFTRILELLEDPFDGFVINMGGVSCELGRKFLNKYFDD